LSVYRESVYECCVFNVFAMRNRFTFSLRNHSENSNSSAMKMWMCYLWCWYASVQNAHCRSCSVL